MFKYLSIIDSVIQSYSSGFRKLETFIQTNRFVQRLGKIPRLEVIQTFSIGNF